MASTLRLVTAIDESPSRIKCNNEVRNAARRVGQGGGRKTNAELRPCEYLEEPEVERMIAAARKTRHGARNAALVMLMYRHGLRVGEAIGLRWSAVDLAAEKIQIVRLKGRSTKAQHPAQHPLSGPELRILRQLRREEPSGDYVFGGMAKRTAQVVIEKLGAAIGLPFRAHAHMLRHACGFTQANRGMDTRALGDYLGHRSLDSTMIYTQVASERFRGMWGD